MLLSTADDTYGEGEILLDSGQYCVMAQCMPRLPFWTPWSRISWSRTSHQASYSCKYRFSSFRCEFLRRSFARRVCPIFTAFHLHRGKAGDWLSFSLGAGCFPFLFGLYKKALFDVTPPIWVQHLTNQILHPLEFRFGICLGFQVCAMKPTTCL